MSEESDEPQAGPSSAGLDWPNLERNRAGVPGGVIRRASGQGCMSWIQKVLEQIVDSPLTWVTPKEVAFVSVLAVQRYLLEEPDDNVRGGPLYCYDVTISDGVYREKCYLDPSLNSLVYKNILKVGIEMKISRVSCLYNEKRLGQGILCIDNVQCGRTLDAISLETPFRNRAQGVKPERPLRGGKSHYLALWNNEDPYGDIWLTDKQPKEHNFTNTKIISLSHLETTWTDRSDFPALLVRILRQSKLRYYGKPDKKTIEPYQTVLEVADRSGTVLVILWNALCPEWYKSLRVGLVLLLQDYSVKKSYQFRMHPLPVNPHIKSISTMEIGLNLQDPPTNIIIIPENQVKPEWKLPKLNYQFITRSELDDMPKDTICDVIGLLVFVGRVQRSKKKENCEDFWSYRWIHLADGTSEQPFIVELFSTSQPEIFENIYPMTHFMCTQLKVVRHDAQVPKLLYLTTTNESRVFIIGELNDQPYTNDIKVQNFIQWVTRKTESGQVENTVIGGYYPYPPVPETFSKYSNFIKAHSFLTPVSEVKKEIEVLQYREQKRIAIQGIITVIKYIPHSSAVKSASASETLWNANRSSASPAAREETESQEGNRKCYQYDRPVSSQCIQTISSSFSPSHKRRILQGPCAKPFAVPQTEASTQISGDRLGMPSIFQYWKSSEGKMPKTFTDRWESQMWRDKKYHVTDHLHYSQVYPESIPRKFLFEHRNFLTQQYNSQPSKYIPPAERPPKLEDFKSARSLGHFEITILGLNHDIAIDVAFLPMYSPEDVRTSQIDTLLTCMNYSCVYPQTVTDIDQCSDPEALAGDIIKAVTELDRVHIVGILDICNLGNNKVEIYLQKIYTPEDTS
ncbi:RPA-related protein RADX isoform X1 [Ochotona princeps]|uniref:RPA-related protein RADX isoform X1 n=1 Tax=Ochotona princeps TaxID=9978 RepID=UPI00032B10DF|nr:RPA-related protein RADX isoform X1 [Ochotona princeps]